MELSTSGIDSGEEIWMGLVQTLAGARESVYELAGGVTGLCNSRFAWGCYCEEE